MSPRRVKRRRWTSRRPLTTARHALARLRLRIAFRPAGSRVTLSNLAQALVTGVVAVAVAAGTLLASSAAGQWQQSLRDELKRAAAMVEDIRFVYGDEAPFALELALAEARQAELAGSDAETEREAVFAIRQEAPADALVSDRYRRPGEGYDVASRLADVRARHGAWAGLHPDAALAEGDRRNRLAMLLLVAAVPLVLLYVIADLVLRRRASRAPASAATGTDAGIVPRPWSVPGSQRAAVAVALGAWLTITMLPALQVHFASREQRGQAVAARQASEVSTMLETSGLHFTFATTSEQRVAWLEAHAVAREIAAADAAHAASARRLRRQARTEEAIAKRASAIVEAMSRRPTPADGVDAQTRTAINATPAIADTLRREQNAELARAETAGARANRVTLAILLGALAASLCALAAAARFRRPTSLDIAAAGVLAMSLAALVSVAWL